MRSATSALCLHALLLSLAAGHGMAQEAAAPAGAPLGRFTGGSGPVEVPFMLERDRAVIRARVNGSRPLRFIVDTGSQTPNLRGAAGADSLDLRIIGVATVRGAGGGEPVRARIAGDVTFDFGGATLRIPEMVVPPPSAAGAAPGSPGVIGRPLFESFVVEFDWERRIIRLHDPASYRGSAKGAVVPLAFDETGSPYAGAAVSVRGGDPVPVSLLIDTGANLALGLDLGSHAGLGLPERSLAATVATGAQGAITGYAGRVHALTLGGYRFGDVLADFAAEGSPFVGVEGRHGLIGTEVLRRFRVTFDFSRERMILEPNRFFRSPFGGSNTGFSYTRPDPAGVLRLTGVLPGSPAHAAGLRAGDEIIAIDGRSASDFTDDQLYRRFRASGVRVTLVVRRHGIEYPIRLRLRPFI